MYKEIRRNMESIQDADLLDANREILASLKDRGYSAIYVRHPYAVFQRHHGNVIVWDYEQPYNDPDHGKFHVHMYSPGEAAHLLLCMFSEKEVPSTGRVKAALKQLRK
jgi:hypothetical protein